MSSDGRPGETAGLVTPYDAPAETLEALTHPRRVAVISILRRWDGDLALGDLATRLVARESEEPLVAVADDERERVRLSLFHSHLPALDDRGLVEWDREDGTVELGDAAPEADSKLYSLLRSHPDGAADALFATLANGRRRITLSVLDEREGAVPVGDLAERVAAREVGTDPDDPPASDRERIEVSLYHAHLPAMADAGLLEFDPDGGEVALDEHPLLIDR